MRRICKADDQSNSPCDDGKSDYNLKFETVKILTRTNVDYSGPLLAHGKKAYDELLVQRYVVLKKIILGHANLVDH